MKENKDPISRRGRSYMERPENIANTRQSFLIVCEGEQTEPKYFKQFKFPGVVVKVNGCGQNTVGVVEQALKLRDEDQYDQVWCVFDKDDFPVDRFENAIKRARSKGIHVAYSNQAFELWYVLHFSYLHSGINRNAYIELLNNYLGIRYQKNDPLMYQRLRCHLNDAISNAQKLIAEYTNPHPGRDDPSTTVHELVIELLNQTRPFSERTSGNQ